jgi:general secretion pathway protein M
VTDLRRLPAACILSWAVALAVPLALLAAIGWPWLTQVRDLEQEIQSLDDRIGHYHRLLKTLPGLQAELERVKSNDEFKDFYFDAKTRALAGAELQSAVQQMVASAGGQVTSTQLLPSPDDEQPPKVRVRTQIKGTTDALLDVLYQIEQARPFLFVEQLSVRAHARRRLPRRSSRSRRRPRSVRRPSQEGLLTVRLDLFGYALGETH